VAAEYGTGPGRLPHRLARHDGGHQQGAQDVGNVTEAAEIVEDNYFFGVQAIDKDGNVSVATVPLLR
jgi:hypothetical protein